MKILTHTRYDSIIKAAGERFLPGVDWRLVKAQLFQESGLNPLAVSPAGAQGIAQFMPATWQDMKRKMNMPAGASPLDPAFAIPALCYYMAHLHEEWTAKREDADRYALALASYNAGLGNILDAQRQAGGVNDYRGIIAALPHVTGQVNAQETRGYVEMIFTYFVQQIVGGA